MFVSGLKGPAQNRQRQQKRFYPPNARLDPSTREGRLVAGIQPVRECIRVHRAAVRRLVLTASDSPTLAALERFATDQGVTAIERLTRGELDQLAQGAQHQGAVAFAPELVLSSWEDVVVRPQLLAIALDQIQDP